MPTSPLSAASPMGLSAMKAAAVANMPGFQMGFELDLRYCLKMDRMIPASWERSMMTVCVLKHLRQLFLPLLIYMCRKPQEMAACPGFGRRSIQIKASAIAFPGAGPAPAGKPSVSPDSNPASPPHAALLERCCRLRLAAAD